MSAELIQQGVALSDSVANASATRWTINSVWDAPRALASFRKRASIPTGRVLFFAHVCALRDQWGLRLFPLDPRYAAMPAIAQNVGRILDQLGIFRRLDRRMGSRHKAPGFADGVDPVKGLGVVGLAQEHQVVVVAEDIPDLVDPAANELNLTLEVLPLVSTRRDSGAGLGCGAARADLNHANELHRFADLQQW